MRKLVAEKLEESAVVAYKSRPRDLQKDNHQQGLETQAQPDNVQIIRPNAPEDGRPPEQIPPWGIISHPGWSSPSSSDLPNLQFDPIVRELANLIEAKAVLLALPDPLYDPTPTTAEPPDPPLPDALVVELLQRPATMGLRDYFAHLNTLGMMDDYLGLSTRFLALYEQARFSGNPLDEKDFRHLMAMSADILRGMKVLDDALVAQVRAEKSESVLSGSEKGGQDGAAEESISLVRILRG